MRLLTPLPRAVPATALGQLGTALLVGQTPTSPRGQEESGSAGRGETSPRPQPQECSSVGPRPCFSSVPIPPPCTSPTCQARTSPTCQALSHKSGRMNAVYAISGFSQCRGLFPRNRGGGEGGRRTRGPGAPGTTSHCAFLHTVTATPPSDLIRHLPFFLRVELENPAD